MTEGTSSTTTNTEEKNMADKLAAVEAAFRATMAMLECEAMGATIPLHHKILKLAAFERFAKEVGKGHLVPKMAQILEIPAESLTAEQQAIQGNPTQIESKKPNV